MLFNYGALRYPDGMQTTLDRLVQGAPARVLTVNGEGPFRRRLMELGLLPGTAIERTGQAPLGDPLQFRVRGAVLCLRASEAAWVAVEAQP